MDTKAIRELAQIMKEMEITALTITEGETVIELERKLGQTQQISPVFIPPQTSVQPSPAIAISSSEAAAPAQQLPPNPETAIEQKNEPVVDFNHLREIKSPMVGIFYAAPSPESEPFVEVGSKVKKGDVLCIIEAMKLMNEITAEEDGEIVDVCVSSGQVVEYSQPLFKLF